MGVLILWSEGGVGVGCRKDGSMCNVGHKFLEKIVLWYENCGYKY